VIRATLCENGYANQLCYRLTGLSVMTKARIGLLFFVAALLFFLAAMIREPSAVYIVLGVVFLILGINSNIKKEEK
jgi:fumarate reductase subunit C